jgi:hypothetical protein
MSPSAETDTAWPRGGDVRERGLMRPARDVAHRGADDLLDGRGHVQEGSEHSLHGLDVAVHIGGGLRSVAHVTGTAAWTAGSSDANSCYARSSSFQ